MVKSKTVFQLFATYNASRWGTDPDFDRVLERAVGHTADGSGCGMGERDLDWQYKTLKGALNAMTRVRAAAKKSHLRLKSYVRGYHPETGYTTPRIRRSNGRVD